MPSKTIIAGISSQDDSSLLAVLEHREDEVELLFLNEYVRADDGDEFWYLNPIIDFLDTHRVKIHQVNIALDSKSVSLLTCMLDATLTQTERSEHIQWELSHYIDAYKSKDYINDIHILETQAQEQVQYVLIVAVQRSVIFGLHNFLKERGLTLGVVDVNHFSAGPALLHSHPEIGAETYASVGMYTARTDVSVLNSGHMMEYRYGGGSEDAIRHLLCEVFEKFSVPSVYLHGTNLTKEHEKIVQSIVQQPPILLNPFRRILISSNFRTFDRYIKGTYRFAAAVGIALRKS